MNPQISTRYHMKPHMLNRGRNRRTGAPPEITDRHIREAVDLIRNIPDWRPQIMELMFISELQLTRMVNFQTKNQETRKDFLRHAQNLAANVSNNSHSDQIKPSES